MNPIELLQLLRNRPFEPFSLRLHDGRVYEIRHPDVVVVGKRSVFIGLYRAEPGGPVDDWVLIAPAAIATVHPIAA